MSPTTASLARLATAVAVATALGTPAASAAPDAGGPPADPAAPGNRGSIWLSGEGGTAPGHHPHLGCGDILVWGARLADAGGTYEIRSWPPTGARAVVATGTWTAPVGDAEVVAVVDGRTLTEAAAAAGAPAHDRQGRHFQITLVQGAGVKHKVFWVDCPAPLAAALPSTPAAPAPAAEADTEVLAAETAAAALEAPAPATRGEAAVTLVAAGPAPGDALVAAGDATLVLGTQVARPEALPLTGGNWAAIIATGMLLTGTGTLLVRRSRRPGEEDGTPGADG